MPAFVTATVSGRPAPVPTTLAPDAGGHAMTDAVIGKARGKARRRGKPAPGHIDFQTLLGPAAWASLPADVQARFDARACARPHAYAGEMQVRANLVGLVMAQVCRLIGTPLAPWRGEAVPVRVDVHTDREGALVWDRLYRFEGRPPAFVSSRKIITERGLMEVVRGGLGMALDLTVEDGALHFRSTGYFLELGRVRVPLPGWITPGRAHVVHADVGGGRFRFTLSFAHPLFGETIFQEGVFADPA